MPSLELLQIPPFSEKIEQSRQGKSKVSTRSVVVDRNTGGNPQSTWITWSGSENWVEAAACHRMDVITKCVAAIMIFTDEKGIDDK